MCEFEDAEAVGITSADQLDNFSRNGGGDRKSDDFTIGEPLSHCGLENEL